MMDGWKILPLGDACDFVRGLTYKKGDEVGASSNIVLRANNITLGKNVLNFAELKYIRDDIEIPTTKIVQKDSLIICTASGSKKHLGKTAFIDQDYGYAFGGFMGMLKPKNFLYPRYFYWLTLSKDYSDFISGLSDGANINNLRFNQLSEFKIPLPPLPEQKRIVAILDKAFAGIDAAVANTEKNLANARELFESTLNGVFTRKGDGWVEKTIAEACTLKSGTTVPKTTEREEGEIPYVKVAAMSLDENQRHITTSTRFLKTTDISPAKIFPVGTTIFPKRGGAIATNKKRLTAVPICADLNVMGVIPGKELVPEFLYHYFLKFDLSTIGSGSSIPQINNYDIEPLVIYYPVSKSDQQAIITDLRNLSEKTVGLESIYQQKLTALAELKQSILQKAFAGELSR